MVWAGGRRRTMVSKSQQKLLKPVTLKFGLPAVWNIWLDPKVNCSL